jgi:propionyl-CoA carboxylase alpha chain
VITNRDLLVRILRDPDFLAGGTDTAYLGRHPEVFEPLLPVDQEPVAYLAAALAAAERRRARADWAGFPSAWRNVRSGPQSTVFRTSTGPIEVHHTLDRDGRLVDGPDGVTLHSATPEAVLLEIGGVIATFRIHAVGGVSYVDGPTGSLTAVEEARFAPPVADQAAGTLLAPMPGVVGRVVVTVGQRVARDDLLLTLEAMKLEHAVRAPEAGTVTDLPVPPGGQVEAGAVLAIVTPDAEQSTEEIR